MHFFKDKHGEVVIGQKPNGPIVVWAVTFGISFLPLPEVVAQIIALISFGALFTWCWLELTSGVNYFRRLLGMIVLVGLIYFAL